MSLTRPKLIGGLAFLLPVALLVAGCTAEKARSLRAAAVQFRVESHAAVDTLETMSEREFEPAPRSEASADRAFVRNLLSLDAAAPLSPRILEQAIDPYAIEPDPRFEQARAELFGKLRRQYAALAEAFEGLEGGSFFAADAVERAGPHARKLTAQMAAFARIVERHPPLLLQRRSATIAQVERVRTSGELSDAEKRRRLLELKERWLRIRSEERQLQQRVMKRCLRAARLGARVCELIRAYDELSLDALQDLVTRALGEADDLTGRDLSELKTRTAATFEAIREDPALNELVETALDEGQALIGRGAASAPSASEGTSPEKE